MELGSQTRVKQLALVYGNETTLFTLMKSLH